MNMDLTMQILQLPIHCPYILPLLHRRILMMWGYRVRWVLRLRENNRDPEAYE